LLPYRSMSPLIIDATENEKKDQREYLKV